MTELDRLKDHMRESFSIQIEHLPDTHSMFFGASPSRGGYVDIPVNFVPNVDPHDVYQAVDYSIEKGQIVAKDWNGRRNDAFQCELSYDELKYLVTSIYEEIEGKKPRVFK